MKKYRSIIVLFLLSNINKLTQSLRAENSMYFLYHKKRFKMTIKQEKKLIKLKHIILLGLLVTIHSSFAMYGSTKKTTVNQYNDFYQSWNYTQFIDTPVGSGGGDVSVDITGDLLTVKFSAGFSANKLKSGFVASFTTSPGLPNMELGFLSLNGGTYTNHVKVSIISNAIIFEHISGNNYQVYTSVNSTFTIDLNPTGTNPDGDGLNWTSSKSRDITGKVIASNKSYFDDLGKNIQNQSLDIKTNKIWASETIYDSQGRPAISTLSAPIGTTEFSYHTDFIKNSSNNPYSTTDFENNTENPSPVGNTSNTLGWYYSENNTTEPYQDITSYPFSRTIYSELNPGAVLKSIGGNKQAGEWKNGYRFSMPAGQELSQSIAFGNSKYSSENYKIIKTVVRDVHGVENVVFTDTDGKTLAAARSGNEEGSIVNTRTSSIKIGAQGYVDVHIPVGRTGIAISGSGAVTIYNLITEVPETINSNSLGNGFYRVAVNNTENYTENSITVTYPENYYDYSLNEYNKAGQLIASYQPLNKLKTEYKYNVLGQLIYTKSPDEGEAWFKYRKDGQIRFSQNSKQALESTFSYTTYDSFGRPTKSGIHSETSFSGGFDSLDPDLTVLASQTNEEHITVYDSYNNVSTKSPLTKSFDQALTDLGLTTQQKEAYKPSFLAGNVAITYTRYPETTTTYYSYDIYGRVQWIVQYINGLGTKTVDYEYDPITSAVTKVDFQKNTPTERFVHKYTYDADSNQLTKVETSTNNLTFTTHAEYAYYETGALKRVNIAEGLQGLDYVYNINGQLKAINHPELSSDKDPNHDTNDLFGMQLNYYDGDYLRSGTNITSSAAGIDQYNGNIKSVMWNTSGLGTTNPDAYYYKYSKNNWLQGAGFNSAIVENSSIPASKTLNTAQTKAEIITATESITLTPGFQTTVGINFTAKIDNSVSNGINTGDDYNVYNITYDANGNIKTLNRNKNTENGSNAMDNFTYHYKAGTPNQLDYVADAVTTTTNANDLKTQLSGNYTYNSIGQLVHNIEENISYDYNASGLVTLIKKNNIPLVKFVYNDKGQRVRKEVLAGNTKTEYYVRDAAGSVLAIYNGATQTELPIYGASRLGVYAKASSTSVYQLTDHLGNVRAVVAKSGNNAIASSATDYYPFGMPMPNRNLTGSEQYRYAFQGQEKDTETGKEAFQLRLWDGRIGRWLTTDPAGQYSSPYLGIGNNPINRADPDGGEDNPVYDINTMEYLGNTESGALGDAVFMKASDFTEGMSDNLAFKGTDAVGVLFDKLAGFQKYEWMNSGKRLKHELGQRDLKYNTLRFDAGKTYDISFIDKTYGGISAGPLGADYSETIITYNGQTILSRGIATGGGLGTDFLSKVKASTITFHTSLVGHSLADVFNQTGLTTSTTYGAVLKHGTITGYDSANKMNKLWTVDVFGTGLKAGFSGDRSTSPFITIK